jgi:hypothetical protein
MSLLAKLESVAANAGTNSEVTTQLPAVASILEEIDEALEDGFQWKDAATVLGAAIPELMKLADTFPDKTGAEKKQFVVDTVWVIYSHYNPDIPWVPEFVENKLEEIAVPKMAEFAIEAVYQLYKKYVATTEGQDEALQKAADEDATETVVEDAAPAESE